MRIVSEQDEARKARKRSCFPSWGFILTITIPFVLMFMICSPAILGGKRTAWESRAKMILHGYGEAQLAYQRVNLDEHYGSWNALQKTGYIPEGYTEGNIMENYFLYTGVNNPAQPPGNMGVTGDYLYRTFTAVAFPRNTSPPGYLATFAIREDQTLRVYRDTTPDANAWGEDGDLGAHTWEPIR